MNIENTSIKSRGRSPETEPVHLAKYVKRVGRPTASAELGVSEATLSKHLNTLKATTVAMEKAAEFELFKQDRNMPAVRTEKTHTVLLRGVSEDQMKILDPFLVGMKINKLTL